MAKRGCPYCRKKDVHHKATVCPYCKKQITPISFWKTKFGIFIVIIGGLWVLGTISSQFKSVPSNVSERALQSELDKAKTIREKAQEQNRREFEDKKGIILAELDEQYRAGKYSEVQKKAAPYLFTKDAELLAIVNMAKEQQILAKIKNAPSSDMESNRKLYALLVKLNPKEEQYKNKLAYFKGKIQEKEKERQARIVRFGEPPELGGWTGKYYIPVKRYIEKAAHDPSSIEFEGCTKVYQVNKGWLVGCIYRGKNTFGAVVKNANWFIIRHNTVVDVKPENTYKW